MHAGLSAGCACIMIPDLVAPELEIKRRATAIFDSLDQAMKLL